MICYKGTVTVSPGANAKVTQNSGQSNAATNSILVAAGQMVVITNDFPPVGFKSNQTPAAVNRPACLPRMFRTRFLLPTMAISARNIWIGTAVGVAVGLAIGVPLGLRGGNNTVNTCTKNPNTGACT